MQGSVNASVRHKSERSSRGSKSRRISHDEQNVSATGKLQAIFDASYLPVLDDSWSSVTGTLDLINLLPDAGTLLPPWKMPSIGENRNVGTKLETLNRPNGLRSLDFEHPSDPEQTDSSISAERALLSSTGSRDPLGAVHAPFGSDSELTCVSAPASLTPSLGLQAKITEVEACLQSRTFGGPGLANDDPHRLADNIERKIDYSEQTHDAVVCSRRVFPAGTDCTPHRNPPEPCTVCSQSLTPGCRNTSTSASDYQST